MLIKQAGCIFASWVSFLRFPDCEATREAVNIICYFVTSLTRNYGTTIEIKSGNTLRCLTVCGG